jgi:pimeloyl-CoA synthetase
METLENVKTLIEGQAILVRQLEAKQKRIDFLETRVEQLEEIIRQKQEETRKTFNIDKIDEMKNKVYLLWLEAEPGVGYNYEQAQEEFYHKYHFRSACVPQRMRDLRQEGKLWSKDVNEKVTFFLTLKEVR